MINHDFVDKLLITFSIRLNTARAEWEMRLPNGVTQLATLAIGRPFFDVQRVRPSGDSYDNALSETVIGLFKTELIDHDGPCRHLDAVELATLEWVAWFNTQRQLEPIGYLPPAEYEEHFHRAHATHSP